MHRLSLLRMVVTVVATMLFASFGWAQTPPSKASPASDGVVQRLRTAVEHNTKGKVIIDAAYPSPVPGIYETVSGDDVFYVDASGRYAFVDGRLVDLVNAVDLTSIRIDQISRIDFSRLPLELAIKEVNGTGRRKLAVFEDPMCPICKTQTRFLSQLPDTTVYRFPFPVIDPKASVEIARAAWCAPDKRSAWTTAMRGGQLPPSPTCDVSGLGRILQLGDSLRIQETPTVFLGDGRRLKGAVPPEEFVKALDASIR
jgi:thiol:disulfide interchange protein DsbC